MDQPCVAESIIKWWTDDPDAIMVASRVCKTWNFYAHKLWESHIKTRLPLLRAIKVCLPLVMDKNVVGRIQVIFSNDFYTKSENRHLWSDKESRRWMMHVVKKGLLKQRSIWHSWQREPDLKNRRWLLRADRERYRPRSLAKEEIHVVYEIDGWAMKTICDILADERHWWPSPELFSFFIFGFFVLFVVSFFWTFSNLVRSLLFGSTLCSLGFFILSQNYRTSHTPFTLSYGHICHLSRRR